MLHLPQVKPTGFSAIVRVALDLVGVNPGGPAATYDGSTQ